MCACVSVCKNICTCVVHVGTMDLRMKHVLLGMCTSTSNHWAISSATGCFVLHSLGEHITVLNSCFCFRSQVAQATHDRELTILLPPLPSAEISGIYQHTVYLVQGTEPRALGILGKHWTPSWVSFLTLSLLFRCCMAVLVLCFRELTVHQASGANTEDSLICKSKGCQ